MVSDEVDRTRRRRRLRRHDFLCPRRNFTKNLGLLCPSRQKTRVSPIDPICYTHYITRVSICMYFRNYSIGPTDLFKVFPRIFIHYRKSLNVMKTTDYIICVPDPPIPHPTPPPAAPPPKMR
jgi:hypothetical protein